MEKEEIIQLIRDVIREELFDIARLERFVFQKDIHVFDKYNILTGRNIGCKIATEADQKIGFFGTTPVVQQATTTDPSGAGVSVDQDVECRAAVSDLITALENLGLIA